VQFFNRRAPLEESIADCTEEILLDATAVRGERAARMTYPESREIIKEKEVITTSRQRGFGISSRLTLTIERFTRREGGRDEDA
jgi:hypothetical protein